MRRVILMRSIRMLTVMSLPAILPNKRMSSICLELLLQLRSYWVLVGQAWDDL